jgi:hypothetical protein
MKPTVDVLLNTSGFVHTTICTDLRTVQVGKDSLFHLNTFFATPPVSRAEAKVCCCNKHYRNQSKGS